MANSDYYPRIDSLIENIDRSFTNRFHLTQPYQDVDIIPGERYGLISWQSIDSDPDRPDLEFVRSGIEAKRAIGNLLLTTGFSREGYDDQWAFRKANKVFFQEAVDINHRLALMLQDIYDEGFVYDLIVDGEIDRNSYVPLRDKTLWVVQISCDIALKFVLRRELDGTLKLPLTT